jgi:hypothetical protein
MIFTFFINHIFLVIVPIEELFSRYGFGVLGFECERDDGGIEENPLSFCDIPLHKGRQ